MIRANEFCKLLLAAAVVAATTFTMGCHGGSHPDDRQAVYNALDKNDLASVIVDQNQGNGVIKLSGIVGSQQRKEHAEQLAQQAAPGYKIDNELKVDQSNILNSPSTPPGNQPNPASNQTAGAVVKAKPKK